MKIRSVMIAALLVTAGCSLGAPTDGEEEQDTAGFTAGGDHDDDEGDDRAFGAPNDDPEMGGDPDEVDRPGFAAAATR